MNVGVLSLQPEAWASIWRSTHFIDASLARRWPVVWMDPPAEWRQAMRSSLLPRFDRTVAERRLEVYTPPAYLPKLHRPAFLSRATARARLRHAVRRLRQLGCDQVVLYAWRPEYVQDLDLIPHDLLVYHVVDEYSYATEDLPTREPELSMIRRADQVILHSPGLMEKKGAIAPDRTAFVPNGVRYDAFAAEHPEPPELVGIPRPRIGYVGALKRQIDWSIVRQLVAARPDWHWIFVGDWLESHADLAPVRAWLEARANVHFTGHIPVDRLGAFPAYFDVGVLPYVDDGYTRYIYPLKLHEYFAAGLPTVGTPVRSLQDFANEVHLARSAGEWEAAIRASLAPEERSPSVVARRRAVARLHDWDALVDRIAEMIEDRLARKGAATT